MSAGAEMVMAAAGQMSGSSRSLAGATEQGASLEETSASVEELALMTRKNADATTEVVGHRRKSIRARANRTRRCTTWLPQWRASKTRAAGLEDHQDDRRSRSRRTSSRSTRLSRRARGRGGHGLRRGCRRSPQPAHRSAQAAQDTTALISSRSRARRAAPDRSNGSDDVDSSIRTQS